MPASKPFMTLSLCEIAPSWPDARAFGVLVHELSASQPAFAGELPKRIYVGSSFCPQLLLALSVGCIQAAAEWCEAHDCALTLVLPIATERNLDACNARALQLITAAHGALDEVTVNDYGAFISWGQRAAEGLGISLNLGRLLNKDTRDPRDPTYHEAAYAPRMLEAGWQGWGSIERLMQTYPVAGIEFDPTHTELDLSGMPAGIMPAVYGPLCYMSTGQICEFASVGSEVEEKFRPNTPCSLQCQRTAIRYNGVSGVEFWKIGRSVFFHPEACHVTGVNSYRYVFSPLQEVLG